MPGELTRIKLRRGALRVGESGWAATTLVAYWPSLQLAGGAWKETRRVLQLCLVGDMLVSFSYCLIDLS